MGNSWQYRPSEKENSSKDNLKLDLDILVEILADSKMFDVADTNLALNEEKKEQIFDAIYRSLDSDPVLRKAELTKEDVKLFASKLYPKMFGDLKPTQERTEKCNWLSKNAIEFHVKDKVPEDSKYTPRTAYKQMVYQMDFGAKQKFFTVYSLN